MKAIRLCGECADYDMKKHRCKRGAHIEENPRNPFYDDCPLADVVEVVHGRWEDIVDFGGGNCYGLCSVCKTEHKAENATAAENRGSSLPHTGLCQCIRVPEV